MAEPENYFALHGETMMDNGYAVIPIAPGTKKPGRFAGGQWQDLAGWRNMKKPTPFHINLWSQWPGAGVGIICGTVIGIDIDVLDEDISRKVTASILEDLGGEPLIRIGRHPKTMLVYRTDKPFPKILMAPLECLAEGQQFVAFAVHPDTGKAYTWADESPATTSVSQLPCVGEAEVRAAMAKAYSLIPEEMRPKRLPGTRTDGTQRAKPTFAEDLLGTPEAIVQAVEQIHNEDLHWDDWNRIGMAIFAASKGEAFETFDRFSQRSTKYSPKETLRRWESYAKSPPTSIGMGTLIHIAQEAGWQPEPELQFNPEKQAAADNIVAVDFSGLLANATRRYDREATSVLMPTEEERAILAKVTPKSEKREEFPEEWFQTTSLVGEIVRWIIRTAMFPHPTLALANTLVLLGCVYGRRYRAARTRTLTNVLILGVAPTGSGKEHSRKAIKSLMMAAGLKDMIGGDELKSATAITNMLFEYPSRICHIDEWGKYLAGVQDRNAASYKREIGSILLRAYSAAGSTWHGAEMADRKNNPRVDVESPNLNIYGTTNAETLIPALNKQLALDGTLSRMLLIPTFDFHPPHQWDHELPDVPDDLKLRLKASAAVKPANAGNMANAAQGTPNVPPQFIDVVWDDSVEMMLRDIGELNQQLKAGVNGPLWVRMYEYVIKLAMIEAISRDPATPVVTEDIVIMSYKLVEWCITYAIGLMDADVAENETEARWKRMLRIVRDIGPGGIAKTGITNATKDLTTRERDDVLKSLIEGGHVVETKVAPAGGRGRPSVIYCAVNNDKEAPK